MVVFPLKYEKELIKQFLNNNKKKLAYEIAFRYFITNFNLNIEKEQDCALLKYGGIDFLITDIDFEQLKDTIEEVLESGKFEY